MVAVMLFGNKSECENARRLIEEACDNKEQKAKQRAKEYEKKKDEKRRDRQLYHMRHTHDYEELELPLGASKVCPHCMLLSGKYLCLAVCMCAVAAAGATFTNTTWCVAHGHHAAVTGSFSLQS